MLGAEVPQRFLYFFHVVRICQADALHYNLNPVIEIAVWDVPGIRRHKIRQRTLSVFRHYWEVLVEAALAFLLFAYSSE